MNADALSKVHPLTYPPEVSVPEGVAPGTGGVATRGTMSVVGEGGRYVTERHRGGRIVQRMSSLLKLERTGMFTRALTTTTLEQRAAAVPKAQTSETKAKASAKSAMYQGERRWWILMDDSELANQWEVVVAITMIYVALITPFEVAFVNPQPVFADEVKSVWFAMNRALEVIFMSDICLQFIRAHRDENDVLIHHPRRIAKHYLQSWFALDIVSTVPYDLIFGLMDRRRGSNGIKALKLVRVLRLVRLLKLARLLKGMAVMRRMGVEISLDYNMLEVFKFLFVTVIYAHWMACLMGITTSLQSSEKSYLLPHYSDRGFETYDQLRNAVPPHSLYLSSLYWSIMTITTIGYGDITPETAMEELVTCVCMMLGAFHFGYVIGTVAGILNSRNKKSQMFREKLNNLNDFMHEFKFKDDTQKELRQFMHYQHSNVDVSEYQEVLAELSPELRGIASLKINTKWIQKLHVFRGAPHGFFYDLSAVLDQVVYPPSETIVEVGATMTCMLILKRGLALVHGISGSRVQGGGEIFGSLCLYKATVSVTKVEAITYVTLFSIDRDAAEGVFRNYPEQQQKFRKHAIHTLFFEELISFKNACVIDAHRRKVANMSEVERDTEAEQREIRIEKSRRSLATAASGYSSAEEKLENASRHPRVKWYLIKLNIQAMCESSGIEATVVRMQRRWRKYFYSKRASGTLRSQQAPTIEAMPKMILTVMQQIANLRRYMEEAGLIKEDQSADVLVDVASNSFKMQGPTKPGSHSHSANFKHYMSVVHTTPMASMREFISSADSSKSPKLRPTKIASSGLSTSSGTAEGAGMSADQLRDIKDTIRSVVSEEIGKQVRAAVNESFGMQPSASDAPSTAVP